MADSRARRNPREYRSFAEGYLDLDLNNRYIVHKAASHYVSAPGDRIDGIHPGTPLIVDRALTPEVGQVVLVAEVEDAYVIRRLIRLMRSLWRAGLQQQLCLLRGDVWQGLGNAQALCPTNEGLQCG